MNQEIIRIDLQGVNCYLGKEGGNFILFDTGGPLTLDPTFTDRSEALIKELERLGCKPGNLKLILLTHGDIDHVGNAVTIRDRFQTQIAMHPGDLELVESPTLEKMMRSFNYRSPIYKLIFRIMKKQIARISEKILTVFKTFSPDIMVTEGDSLLQYGFNAKVLHIPGHTAGSIGILTENNDLIAGDIMINLKKPGIAPNANDFKILEESMKRIKLLNLNMIYPGHGLPFRMSDLL